MYFPDTKLSKTALMLLGIFLFSLAIDLPALSMSASYEISARLDEEEDLISGTARVEFSNPKDQPISQVVLKLLANLHREANPYLSGPALDNTYPTGFDPGWTQVHQVSGPGGGKLNYRLEELPPSNQTFSLADTLLRVELAETLAPGERTELEVDFSTKIPNKRSPDEKNYREVYTWRFGWYPTLTPPEWWRDFDRDLYRERTFPSADYRVTLDVPEDMTLAGNLISSEKINRDSERKVLEFNLDSARSFPLSASSNYRGISQEFKNYTVEVLHLPGYQQEARLLASYANDILNFLSRNFGEYPREKLTISQSPLPGYFGMASDGTVILGGSVFTEKDLAFSGLTSRLVEYLLAHEIGHQWFGVGVGADFDAKNWISEAFTEFVALRYFHSKYPEFEPNLFRFERDGFIKNMIESQLGFVNLREHEFELPYMVNFRQGFDEEIIKPTEEVQYAQASQIREYKKGYMVLRTLEGAIGEELMDEFVKRVYEMYKNDIVNVEEIAEEARTVAEDQVPEDFFQDWLFTPDFIDYGIEDLTSKNIGDERYLNEITITKRGGLRAPVELELELTSGEIVRERITLEDSRRKLSIETPEKVRRATLDPEHQVMDVNRLNNHYPRKVEISFGENDLPLDAHFIIVGPGTISGRILDRAFWSVGPRSFQGQLNLNRNLTVSGGLAVTGRDVAELDLEGWFEANYDFWTNPQTGYASRFWDQNRSLYLKLERVRGRDGRHHNLLGAGASLSQSLTDDWSLELDSRFSLEGATRFGVSAEERRRLLPNIYLDLSTKIGVGFGDLPRFMKFDLPELKSYGTWNPSGGTASWQRTSFPGNYKLFSRMGIDFPLIYDENYYIGNLALIEQIRQSVFFSVGNTWEELDEIGLEGFKYEGGVQLGIQGKTLGGLLPFEFGLGYAYHGQDTGRPFFNFSFGL